MATFKRYLPGLALCFFAFAGVSPAQTSSIEGVVKGEDGQPLKDALINIDRKDIKGHYQVKTKKKGDYFHAGLPLGTYNITVEVDGKDMDSMGNVKPRLGDPLPVNFDLSAKKKQAEAMQKQVDAGQMPVEAERGMTAAQKAALEKSIKERQAQMSKNKALNDAFNAGRDRKVQGGGGDGPQAARDLGQHGRCLFRPSGKDDRGRAGEELRGRVRCLQESNRAEAGRCRLSQ